MGKHRLPPQPQADQTLEELIDAIIFLTQGNPPGHLSKKELKRFAMERRSLILHAVKSYGARVRYEASAVAEERRNVAERAAMTDELTGFGNRRALDAARESAERDPDIAFILFDGDNVGKLNKAEDGEKHKSGDDGIKTIARYIEMAAIMGSSHRVFRLGGDEFVVLAPKSMAEHVLSLAESFVEATVRGDMPMLHDGAEDLPRLMAKYNVGVTGSIGNTLQEADANLQERKRINKEERLRLRDSESTVDVRPR